MEGFRIEHELNNTFLIISESTIYEDDYRNKMLEENKINGLLDVKHRTMDGVTQLYADISELQSVEDLYLIKDMKRDEVIELYEAIYHIVDTVSNYFIEEGNISLNPKLIFTDIRTGKYKFLCIPGGNPESEKNDNIKNLLLFLMQHVDTSDEFLVKNIFDLYGYAETGNLHYVSLYKFLMDKQNDCNEEKIFPETKEEDEDTICVKPREKKSYYIPSIKECVALLLCAIGFGLIGYDIYLSMLL